MIDKVKFSRLLKIATKEGNIKDNISYDGWTGIFKKVIHNHYEIYLEKGNDILSTIYYSPTFSRKNGFYPIQHLKKDEPNEPVLVDFI